MSWGRSPQSLPVWRGAYPCPILGATNPPRAASHQILRQPLPRLLPIKPSLDLALGCRAELRTSAGQGAGSACAWC